MRLKSFLTRPRLIINSFVLVSFCALWIRDVIYWFTKDAFGTSLNYWAYTDWLIDYSQGFIRRGLSGEMWRLIPASIPPLVFVAALSWILILVAAFGYVRLLSRSWKDFHPLTLFGLLFLPSLFVFYLHDHNAIARKEILGYVTVLLHLLVVEKTLPLKEGSKPSGTNLRRYVGWVLPITVILLPAIVLVHEGNFLLFVPLHTMITLTIIQMIARPGNRKAVLWTGLLYIPAAIAFGVVYLSGTPGYPMLLGICEKWAAAGAIREGSCVLPPDKLSGSTLPGSFIPMQWTLPKAAGITAMIISMNWKAWIIILPTLFVSLWYLSRQALYSILRSRFPQSFTLPSVLSYTSLFFRKYFLIPFMFSLPTYLTAYDYGRWFTVACINFAMLAVSANLPCMEFDLRVKDNDAGTTPIITPEHLDHHLVFYGVSIVLCILVLVLWLPHYCLFSCDIIRSPLEFFSHSFYAH